MSDPSKVQDGQLQCLLSDFVSIKAEIGRRSNLQRVVLGAYIGVVAFVFRESAQGGLSALWVVGLWAACALALQFYVREGLEIGRLGGVIRSRIAPAASKILEVAPQQLFPSETDPEATGTEVTRRAYNKEFFWIVFFALPSLITVWFIGDRRDHMARLIDFRSAYPWLGIMAMVAAGRSVALLKRWFSNGG